MSPLADGTGSAGGSSQTHLVPGSISIAADGEEDSPKPNVHSAVANAPDQTPTSAAAMTAHQQSVDALTAAMRRLVLCSSVCAAGADDGPPRHAHAVVEAQQSPGDSPQTASNVSAMDEFDWDALRASLMSPLADGTGSAGGSSQAQLVPGSIRIAADGEGQAMQQQQPEGDGGFLPAATAALSWYVTIHVCDSCICLLPCLAVDCCPSHMLCIYCDGSISACSKHDQQIQWERAHDLC